MITFHIKSTCYALVYKRSITLFGSGSELHDMIKLKGKQSSGEKIRVVFTVNHDFFM